MKLVLANINYFFNEGVDKWINKYIVNYFYDIRMKSFIGCAQIGCWLRIRTNSLFRLGHWIPSR